MRDFYKILLLSQSGKGKTYSSRNMNPETTGFVNVENKPLPYKNNFKHYFRPEGKNPGQDLSDTEKAIVTYALDKTINAIFIDSFSAITDIVLAQARKSYKGFDVWNFYNTEIARIINLIKRCPKEVFVTGHYEILGIEGAPEKRAKVKGKEWEGVLEKEFTMVLYGTSKTKENGRPEYFFNLYEQDSSSKCPPEIFGEDVLQIPNDSNYILEKVLEFTK